MTDKVVPLAPKIDPVVFKHSLREVYLHLDTAPTLAQTMFEDCIHLLVEHKSLRTPTNVNSLLDVARNSGNHRADFLTALDDFMNTHGNSISGSMCLQNRETGKLENVSAARVVRHIIAVALGLSQHEDAPSTAKREQHLAPLPKARSLVLARG